MSTQPAQIEISRHPNPHLNYRRIAVATYTNINWEAQIAELTVTIHHYADDDNTLVAIPYPSVKCTNKANMNVRVDAATGLVVEPILYTEVDGETVAELNPAYDTAIPEFQFLCQQPVGTATTVKEALDQIIINYIQLNDVRGYYGDRIYQRAGTLIGY